MSPEPINIEQIAAELRAAEQQKAELHRNAKIELINFLFDDFVQLACRIALAQSPSDVKAICIGRNTTEEMADYVYDQICGEWFCKMALLMKWQFPAVTDDEAYDIIADHDWILEKHMDEIFEQKEAANPDGVSS